MPLAPKISDDPKARFRESITRLVTRYKQDREYYCSSEYDETTLRLQFVDEFFRSLGWDVTNTKGTPPHLCDVVVERRNGVHGKQKRVDYLFRTRGVNRFVCEAKRPLEHLPRHAFQVQNYIYNLSLYVGVLTNFEELSIFVVGARPNKEQPFPPTLTLFYTDYLAHADFLWDLLAECNVSKGSIENYVQELPKKGSGRIRQGWLFKAERTRTVDEDFLDYLNGARLKLAEDLVENNKPFEWGEHRLDEAVQIILDRLLFLRISEDRDIDVLTPLEDLVREWRERGSQSSQLYRSVVAHFRQLAPIFNGGLFGKRDAPRHFSESLLVSDAWLSGIIEDLSAEDSNYLFSTIPVEILGAVYEQFLGKVIVLGRSGVQIKEKPEVKKAGGVYYTPKFVVDYIVENTVGKLSAGKTPNQLRALRIVDPACGSGSFLIRAFERLCERHVEWFMAHPTRKTATECYVDDQGTLRLTTALKRCIALDCIFGVDIDEQAVQVAQLSLYLKMLEGETRQTLLAQKDLFRGQALLPDLSKNIQVGNSLIDETAWTSLDDVSVVERLRPFDWRKGFPFLETSGGFDVVIGNPPYVRPKNIPATTKTLLWKTYVTFEKKADLFACFTERGVALTKVGGAFSFILPKTWTSLESFTAMRRNLLMQTLVRVLTRLPKRVFKKAAVETCILAVEKSSPTTNKSRAQVRRERLTADAVVTLERTFPQRSIEQAFLNNFQLEVTESTRSILEKMAKAEKKLGTFVNLTYGFKTAADSKFISDTPRHQQSEPFVRSANIFRYFHSEPTEYVWYAPNKMTAHRKTARPGDRERFESEKILISRMGNKELAASYDPEGLFVKDAMLLLPRNKNTDLKFIVGVLNSTLMRLYYREYFVTIDVLKNALLSLPIPAIAPSNVGRNQLRDTVVQGVDKMIRLQKAFANAASRERTSLANGIASVDKQIDAAVYALFTLSPEEISAVEEAMSNEKPPRIAREE